MCFFFSNFEDRTKSKKIKGFHFKCPLWRPKFLKCLRSGKTFDTNLKKILGEGIDETDIGILGIFTGKAKPSVADQARLKKLVIFL